jgi:protein-S-isoprenylcysteine O-methyltransferase Ste14
MNLLGVLLFVLLAVASYHQFVRSGSVRAFGVLAANSLFLALFLIRRHPTSETTSLKLWVLAFAGSTVSLLIRPTAGHFTLALGYPIQLVGLAMLITALLSLRRSFAIVPGNRGIRDGGLYRLVRHPVYLSELTTFLGVVLANHTPLNGAIWACLCLIQLARARAEERFLSADPVYRAYCARVRYRLIPGVL